MEAPGEGLVTGLPSGFQVGEFLAESCISDGSASFSSSALLRRPLFFDKFRYGLQFDTGGALQLT